VSWVPTLHDLGPHVSITEGEAVRSRPGTSSAFIALFLLYCGWLIGPFAILRPFIWFCASFDAQYVSILLKTPAVRREISLQSNQRRL
jgi:hypothetical protein